MSVSRLMLVAIFVALAGSALWLIMTGNSGDQGRNSGGRAVTVVAEPVMMRSFADVVEALGTARAHESVVVTSRVTDTVDQVFFEDGQIVETGDLLIRLIAVEEEAQLKEAAGNVKEAQRNFTRVEGLVQNGNASAAALDEARRRLAEVRSRYAAANARLEDRQIKAPFAGVLGLRNVSEGSLVTSNTQITTIDKIDIINLDFAVPERFISVLGRGQPVVASVDAYAGETFEGVVKTIDSRVDPATRSVIVRAEIPNPDSRLRPGMLMRVRVTSRIWNAFAVREESVVSQAGQDYVIVISGEVADRKTVTLGARVPGFVEVTEGLTANERVVTQGTQRLGRPGIRVQEIRTSDDTEPSRSAQAEGR